MAFNDLSEAATEVCVPTKSPELPRPTGLTVLSRTDTSLTIRWTDNADGEDNYRFTWGLATDATVTHVATVAAHPGVGGEMTYTITGLTPLTVYRFAVLPVKTGHDRGDTVESGGATSGSPRVDAFTSSVGSIQACAAQSVTLNWSVTGAGRVVVSRGRHRRVGPEPGPLPVVGLGGRWHP